MKIQSIKIKNYRSTKNISIDIDEISNRRALVLLGINETGKSNILKAISLLNKDHATDYNIDCNKIAIDEGESIEIGYNLIIIDHNNYKKEFEKLLGEELANSTYIKSIVRKITIDKWLKR